MYSSIDEQTAIDTVLTALAECGYGGADTAPLYGGGASEIRLGKAVALLPEDIIAGGHSSSDRALKIWTKVGRVLYHSSDPAASSSAAHPDNLSIFHAPDMLVPVFDFSAGGVRKSLDDSKQRMGAAAAKCIYGARVHDCDGESNLATTIAQSLPELAKMREQGLIRAVGLGVNDPSLVTAAVQQSEAGVVDEVMLAGCFNLVDVSGLEAMNLCLERGVRVHNAGVFGSGLLWGGSTLRYSTAPPEMVALAGRWDRLAKEHEVTLPAVALQFAFAHKAVEMCAVGCASPEQVRSNKGLLEQAIPKKLWKEAKEDGLLPKEVSVPSWEGDDEG